LASRRNGGKCEWLYRNVCRIRQELNRCVINTAPLSGADFCLPHVDEMRWGAFA
jgi:hypothetical protein